MGNRNLKFAYFGTDIFSVEVLEQLRNAEFIPKVIVTAPDRPCGRGQRIQKPAVKIWAEENIPNAKILQPEKLDNEFINTLKESIDTWDIFVVASYGKIIPREVVDMPRHGSLNVHPSLIPLYRGASPIESAMLEDAKTTGVTIILVDERMDHGPILNQEIVKFDEWPSRIEVEKKMAIIGGRLLSSTIPLWVAGEIEALEQDHDRATFTKKITKDMGTIEFDKATGSLGGDARKNFLKIQALNPWPGAYFFINKDGRDLRVKITLAVWVDDELRILKVIPEGKREMNFADFKSGFLG